MAQAECWAAPPCGFFAESDAHQLVGAVRSNASKALFPEKLRKHLVVGGDVENPDSLIQLFQTVRPQVVINCIGLIKQLSHAGDAAQRHPGQRPAAAPHRAPVRPGRRAAGAHQHRLRFFGKKGGYLESDAPDAEDLYGRSKLLGEVDYPHAITLRTSIIGHELAGANGLIGWFLQQQGRVQRLQPGDFLGPAHRGTGPPDPRALSCREPTCTASTTWPRPPSTNTSSSPWSPPAYGKNNRHHPRIQTPVIDRSLNAQRFNAATGYAPPPWPELAETHARRLTEKSYPSTMFDNKTFF